MNQTQANQAVKDLLKNPSAEVFFDEESPLYPYLVAIKTPAGELGVVASGQNWSDAVEKAKLWKASEEEMSMDRLPAIEIRKREISSP